jgi:hypothetical protein
MAAMDEFERYGVILTDRAQSRLFTVFMGEIEEHHEAFAEDEVRHSKTTGKDQICLAEKTIDMDGKFEQIRAAATGRLRETGGVGALLRY